MSTLLLRSGKSSALLDQKTNSVEFKGKKLQLEPNLIISPGDVVTIKGEQFVALGPDPIFFREFARRTAQIIQPWDAAAIISYCSISPGKKVLESGAGSGALSASILHALGKTGQLTTIEIEQTNIDAARENVLKTSSLDNWNIVHSDISEYDSDDRFDAAVLDLPEPWEVVGKVAKYLRIGGRICCYSPTYNQLEKNVKALKENGFHVFENMELMKRTILVRENATRPDNDVIGHTAFMTFAVKLSGRDTKI